MNRRGALAVEDLLNLVLVFVLVVLAVRWLTDRL